VISVTILRFPELKEVEVSIWNAYEATPLSESDAEFQAKVGVGFVVPNPLLGDDSEGVLGGVWSTPNWFDHDQSDSNPELSKATAATHTDGSLLLKPPQSHVILQPFAPFVSSPIIQ
jgi:hypothetical protein